MIRIAGLLIVHLGWLPALELVLDPGSIERRPAVITAPLQLPPEWQDVSTLRLSGLAEPVLAQLVAPGVDGPAAAGNGWRVLHAVIPRLDAGVTVRLRAEAVEGPTEDGHWLAVEDGRDLQIGGRPLLRAVLPQHDPARHELSYKPFHHVFAPEGEPVLLSKGAGGRYTHHRGLFFGYSKVAIGDRRVDIWHCKNQAHQQHEAVVEEVAGPVFARHQLRIGWYADADSRFAEELREVAVQRSGQASVIDWRTRLTATVPELRLDGDPQHAGFHFRAADVVAQSSAGETYYLRPDGADRPGSYRNYPQQRDQLDLSWTAMSAVIHRRRFTIAYLVHPDNQGQAQHSERDYGRFGSFVPYRLTEGESLVLRYRLVVVADDPGVEAIAAWDADFDQPVQVRVAE